MFNVEPEETWTAEDIAEINTFAARQLQDMVRRAAISGTVLLACILLIVPFLAGFPLHRHWEQAKFLIYLADVLLPWFVIRVVMVWSSWQSARDTRRELGDPFKTPTD